MNRWTASDWVFSEGRMSKILLFCWSTPMKQFLESMWIFFFFFKSENRVPDLISMLQSSLNLFIYLLLAVLGLRFCARAFSSCGKWGPLFIAVRGPLTIAASLVAEHRLQTRRLSNRGSRAQLLRGMWDLPRPGLKPVFPALAGRFSTTAPPGKPLNFVFYSLYLTRVLKKNFKKC